MALHHSQLYFEFKNAKVSDEDCVFIGQYENYIYYSTDGNIAKKLTDKQLLVMTYSESKNSVNEEIEQVATEDTNKSEESTEQIIDNEGGTEQPEELNVPESISVQSLDEALQISVANGDENAISTDRVEYVDVNGSPIENAPTTIELGTIADHKDLAIASSASKSLSVKVKSSAFLLCSSFKYSVPSLAVLFIVTRYTPSLSYAIVTVSSF